MPLLLASARPSRRRREGRCQLRPVPAHDTTATPLVGAGFSHGVARVSILRLMQPEGNADEMTTTANTRRNSRAGGPHRPPPRRPPRAPKGLLGRLGPGLITGASDDDPSGIATYSQAGAQFGYAMCWVMLFCFPLMAAIQEISARIGRVTGQGIAGNIRAHYPRWLLARSSGCCWWPTSSISAPISARWARR